MIKKMKIGMISGLILIFVSPLSAISIDKLKSNPQRYNGDIVRLKGEVTFKSGIPFTDLSVYFLKDKTGSIMVFSAFPKEKDEIVSIKAEVVSYIGAENEESREETIKRLSDYLVDKEILQEAGARRASEVTLNIINSLADTVTGTWFVIELEKSGFFNL